MNSKQLNIVLGVVVVIFLIIIGYIIINDRPQVDKLSSQNNQTNNNPTDAKNTQPASNTNTQTNNNVKTYTNTKEGFQVQYPSDWVVKEENGTISFRPLTSQQTLEKIMADCNDNNSQTICNSEYYLPFNVSYTAELGDRDAASLKGTTTFNGVKFKKYVQGGLFGDYTTYVTLNNERVNLVFSTDDKSVEAMEKILSTFKFTK